MAEPQHTGSRAAIDIAISILLFVTVLAILGMATGVVKTGDILDRTG